MPLPELLSMQPVPAGTTCAAAYGHGTNLKKTGFAPVVRTYHLNRLPLFNTAFSGFICAYCGNETGRRSMQIDHIIPMRVYCRFKMINDPAVGTAVGLDNDSAIARIADRYYADENNLILACQNCNSTKSDVMPNTLVPGLGVSWLDRALANIAGPDMQIMLNNAAVDCVDINWLPGPARHFVLHGTASNTSRMGTRKRDRDTTPAIWIAIQRVLIDRLSISRPSLGREIEFYEADQKPTAAGPARDLRVCLYCLGLFMDQAFQLDHIRPVNRSRIKASVPKKTYNDPCNIVAVCGSCNGSKSNMRATRGWLANRTSARLKEGLPGLDTVLNPADLVKAKAKRLTLLGL